MEPIEKENLAEGQLLRVKKSAGADLERGRLGRLLLGLVVALSMFFVALEYNSYDSMDDLDESLLDDAWIESEMTPITTQDNLKTYVLEDRPATEERLVVDDEPAGDATADEGLKQGLEEDPLAAQEQQDELMPPPEVKGLEEAPLRVVSDLPQFPGGPLEFMRWLTRTLRYPPDAEQRKVQGRVVVQFMVQADGRVTDIEIVQPLDPQCDREALRVMKMMPAWKPGVENDKPCRTKVCVPIVFRLS